MTYNQPSASDNRQGAYTNSELELAHMLGVNHIPYLTQITLELPKREGESYHRYATPDFIVGYAQKIVLEVDGEIHEKARQRQKDFMRDEGLKQMGFTILRFSNTEVKNEKGLILKAIWSALSELRCE